MPIFLAFLVVLTVCRPTFLNEFCIREISSGVQRSRKSRSVSKSRGSFIWELYLCFLSFAALLFCFYFIMKISWSWVSLLSSSSEMSSMLATFFMGSKPPVKRPSELYVFSSTTLLVGSPMPIIWTRSLTISKCLPCLLKDCSGLL